MLFTYNDIFLSFSLQGDQVQNNLDKMETGAGKVACRGARVNIGDMDEMVSIIFYIYYGQNLAFSLIFLPDSMVNNN